MNFVIAAVFDNYINAHLTLGRLQDQDINCWLKDENSVSVYPGSTFALGGIKLMVAEAQIERALAIINGDKAAYQQQHPCPKCGSTNVELISTPRKPDSWMATIANVVKGGGASIPVERVFHCFDCGNEFEPEEGSDTGS